MKRPKRIPAVHREIRPDGTKGPWKGWNGAGLPPEWGEWATWQKLSYATLMLLGVWGVTIFAHWLTALLFHH